MDSIHKYNQNGGDLEQLSDEFNVEDTVGYLVTVVALKIKRKINQILKEGDFEVSPEQFFVLASLHWHGSMSLTQLAKKTYKDNANITRMIDLMEKKGFVERRQDEEDKRAVKLVLTKSGKDMFQEALGHILELKSLMAPGLGEEQLEKYKDISMKLIENLSEQES
jgi:DNA-binding MarR family transcriptional regulator